MQTLTTFIFFILAGGILPFLVIGVIRKTKACFQNRYGASIWQPMYDFFKLIRKDETLSNTASWLFRFTPVVNLVIISYLLICVPWIQPKPSFGGCDLFLVVYLLATMRFFTMLAAMDTASAFGAFAASRETLLSFLTEPAAMLSLVALAVTNRSSDLNSIFAFGQTDSAPAALWLLCGSAMLLASLVELSRMPIDDPTTHLELTMVHEAMILEASGRNLAMIECAQFMKTAMLFGLCAQCFLHADPSLMSGPTATAALSVAVILGIAVGVGIYESVAVKCSWRRNPAFIAYIVSLSLVAVMVALGAKIS